MTEPRLNVEPQFRSEMQETITVGSRVYLVEDTISISKGGEGTYAGEWEEVPDLVKPHGGPVGNTAGSVPVDNSSAYR